MSNREVIRYYLPDEMKEYPSAVAVRRAQYQTIKGEVVIYPFEQVRKPYSVWCEVKIIKFCETEKEAFEEMENFLKYGRKVV